MLGEKRSGDIFGPGPKRETGGQEAMAGEAVNSPKVEPQNEHELRQKKEQVVIPERQPDSDGMSLVEIDRAEEEAGERLLFQESQVPRAHNLFFSPQGEGREFTAPAGDRPRSRGCRPKHRLKTLLSCRQAPAPRQAVPPPFQAYPAPACAGPEGHRLYPLPAPAPAGRLPFSSSLQLEHLVRELWAASS